MFHLLPAKLLPSPVWKFCAVLLAAGACTAMAADNQEATNSWPHWRGPLANGVSPDADPPVKWSDDSNIRWKVELPGEGSGTPIILGNRIYLLAAVRTDRMLDEPQQADERSKTVPPVHYYQFVVLCLDRETGAEVWRQVACEEVPHEGRHFTNSYASGSPMTDGKRIYASFGSRGLFAFEMDGTPIWDRKLGQMRTRYGWGEASTPVIHGDYLLLNWDHEDQSFFVALDAATGETKWKVDRDEPSGWSTPLVVEYDGKTQVIVNGTNRVRSYDLETGEVNWECGGQTVNAIPSPLRHGDMVLCMSGYRGAAAVAIPLDAEGDVTGTETIRWQITRGTPYVPSAVIYEDHVYFTASNTAVLTCLNVNTGEKVFGPERIPGLTNLYASPVAAAGKIYFADRDGHVTVLKHGPEMEVLATNSLDDGFDASPILLDKQLFLRGQKHLYCIEE